MKTLTYFLIGFSGLVILSCNGDEDNSIKDPIIAHKVPGRILSPSNETQYNTGDIVAVDIEINDASQIKEMNLYVDDTLFAGNLKIESQTVKIPTDQGKVGFVDFYLDYTDVADKPHRDNRSIVFFSDILPEQLSAKIVNTYPHSKTSYTQGLEFYQGKLYESTGQIGSSLIAEVDLTTGNQYRFKNLDAPYFGEGITIMNDTIYQLTWRSNICFMYDMAFNKIGEFTYEGEGWGLTNNGKSLIMTGGDSKIVWRNPQTFEIEKTLYAFERETDVTQLNELELIDGKLFINVYLQNRLIEVDTTTGKVLSYIDCTSLSIEGEEVGADVLNGIAYHKETGKIYMTGKLWPKLFEVEFE